MPIKVLNTKTNRYNSLSTMDKPSLKKLVKKMSGKPAPAKATKAVLGKIITKSCKKSLKPTKKRVSSVVKKSSAKPVKKSSKKSSKCPVKRHTKSVGKGKSKHTITIKRYTRKC